MKLPYLKFNRRWLFNSLLFSFFALGLWTSSQIYRVYGQQTNQKRQFKSLTKIIVVRDNFIPLNDPALLVFAKRCGITNIYAEPKNPICCVWIEPLSVDKKLAGEQFVMIHYDYTVIQVTSPKALEMLTKLLTEKGITEALPKGIISSFPDAFEK